MKKNRIWWILGAIVILLTVGLIAAKQAGLIGKPKTTDVDFAAVQKTDIIERVSASGRVQPEIEVKISPDVSGEIIGLYVKEGDPVTADRKSTRLNSSHSTLSRMPSSA